MKRARSRAAAVPRVRVLASCLATALALGTSVFSSDSALASSSNNLDARIAAAIPSGLSAPEREIFKKRLYAAMRTPLEVPAAILVTSCNDSGPGSLRDAVNNAIDGDTIDMTGLACSTITLTSGAISVGQANLTVQGPGVLSLEVNGSDASRVFWHLGSGTLKLYDMAITHGKKYLNDGDVGNAGGGCVFSAGTVQMDHTWTKYCDTGSNSVDSAVRGGAIYAAAGVFMNSSFVTSSSAHSSGFEGRGGGVYTPGNLLMLNSTVSGNVATGGNSTGGGIQVGSRRTPNTDGGSAGVKYSSIAGNSSGAFGGGAYFTGNAAVGNSTISGNATCRGGGLYFVTGANVTNPGSLYSSTVSGNIANCADGAAGVEIFGENVEAKDSTIAFNTTLNAGSTKYGAGVRIWTGNNLDLQNTIISNNNVDDGSELKVDDIGGDSAATVTGANNLIFFPSSLTMPGGTILLTSPMLRALAGNGGATATHMPNFGSPVIDVGNNASGATVDQRGTGYPRILGPAADIGSVEFNLPDLIFANGFD